jgi:iron complex transport system ATP-binding protein
MMGRYPHFGGRPRPIEENIVDELMQFFDVKEFNDRDYQTLSGGEHQRVNFARVLANCGGQTPKHRCFLARSRHLQYADIFSWTSLLLCSTYVTKLIS